MRSNHRFPLISLIGLCLCQGTGVTSELGWAEPARENRPGVIWWIPGSAMDRENITFNLEALQQAGFGGVSMVPIYGAKGAEQRFLDYLSPEWMAMYEFTAKEADRLGLWLDLTPGTGWRIGGPNVTADMGEQKVKIQEGKLVPSPDRSRVKRAAPGGAGRAINPYSSTALEQHLEMFDKTFAESGARMPRAFYHDSFEYTGDWCSEFLEAFKKQHGYDLNDHASELLNQGARETIARVQCDYRQTLSDLHFKFLMTLKAWANGHGAVVREQAHGAPANLLDLYGSCEIPETEVFGASAFDIPGLRRESDKIREDVPNPMVNRFASSAAHVAGRDLTSSESFTWLREHFNVALSHIKPEADQLFLTGINHILYHGNCYSPKDDPWPGWLFYASTQVNPRNAFWRDLPSLNRYITRCQSILQSGKPDKDILLYWPIYDVWSQPEDAPRKSFTVHNPNWISGTPCGETAQWFIANGCAFDFISDAMLLKVRSVNGKLQTGGASYQTVWIPPTTYMPVRTTDQLIRLARSGSTVVFEKGLPEDVPGLGNLAERRSKFRKLKETLDFEDNNDGDSVTSVGQGRFLITSKRERGVALARIKPEPMVRHGLDFIRRTSLSSTDYFIASLRGKTLDGWVRLARSAQAVEIMDPMSGDYGLVPTRAVDGATEIYLQMLPGESRVLRLLAQKIVGGPEWPVLKPSGPVLAIDGAWAVEFMDGEPELPPSLKTSELKSWTVLGDKEAQRFAGTAKYRTEFEVPDVEADQWTLDLGDVRESARVRINGEQASVLVANPFRLKVGKHLKPGRNVLELEVTNLSANRLRDLDLRRVEWKKFYDINFVNIHYREFDASTWPLVDSGLLGPVQLIPQLELKL